MGFKHSVDTNFTNPLANFTIARYGSILNAASGVWQTNSNGHTTESPDCKNMPDGMYEVTTSFIETSQNTYVHLDGGTEAGNIAYMNKLKEMAVRQTRDIRIDKGVGNDVLVRSSAGNIWNVGITFKWRGPL